jgi:hypothetical protein
MILHDGCVCSFKDANMRSGSETGWIATAFCQQSLDAEMQSSL